LIFFQTGKNQKFKVEILFILIINKNDQVSGEKLNFCLKNSEFPEPAWW
jgi:hypothetical protein